MNPAWYVRRLRAMGAPEVTWRLRNAALQELWRARAGEAWPATGARPCWAGGQVPMAAAPGLDTRELVLAAANRVVNDGCWPVFGTQADLAGEDPDWFRDPLTGRRAPTRQYAFRVAHRDAAAVGDVKHVWEVSRLQHLTVLAAAYHVSGDERFACRALDHLRSWCTANPPLLGIHWTSGIEIGLRLLTWTWCRRLLDRLPGIAGRFEGDALVRRQLHAHQSWLATFHSRGTSANNHLVAELAGLLAASRSFPMFPESGRWSALAATKLEREIGRQTFADGLNRELAGEYHVFAAELFLVAGVEADIAGPALSDGYWRGLGRMLDALAATVDARGAGARQGDGDSGRALRFGESDNGIATVLGAGGQALGRPAWWPAGRNRDPGATLLGSMAGDHRTARTAPDARPSAFPAAGVSILRDLVPDADELWCRFDHGPHGFLATAAHAHADALSFELRCGGQEILVDPGTYCYQGEAAWRDYFRSTLAHNALELGGRSQAEPAGPFLWASRADAELIEAAGLQAGDAALAEARHDGYAAPTYRRLRLDRAARSLDVLDWTGGRTPVDARLTYHLHPLVECRLQGACAQLSWAAPEGRRHADIVLPPELSWSAHQGETEPILGWYSARFGVKQPTVTLVGHGRIAPGQKFRTSVAFARTATSPAMPARQAETVQGG